MWLGPGEGSWKVDLLAQLSDVNDSLGETMDAKLATDHTLHQCWLYDQVLFWVSSDLC